MHIIISSHKPKNLAWMNEIYVNIFKYNERRRKGNKKNKKQDSCISISAIDDNGIFLSLSDCNLFCYLCCSSFVPWAHKLINFVAIETKQNDTIKNKSAVLNVNYPLFSFFLLFF